MRGSLTISRPRGGSGPEYIEVRLTDELSGVTFIEAQIELADFTEALVGLANVPCKFELRASYVGMRHEHKRIDVPFEVAYTSDQAERQRLARAAFKKFEVDGWKGNVRDLFNHHNRTSSGYIVTFERYVPIEEQQDKQSIAV